MTTARVNEIDLLRFLAAASVLLFHLTFRGYTNADMSEVTFHGLAPVTKYGFLGVQLFFVISGFVILMTAAGGDLRKFAVSRFVRLYPAFWVCCVITFAAIMIWGGERFSATWTQLLANLTMMPKVFGAPLLDGSYWSLLVELQFYALVAGVLLIRQIQRAEIVLYLWLAASWGLNFLPIGPLEVLLLAGYSEYFIAGSLCYLIWAHGLTVWRCAGILASYALTVVNMREAILYIEKDLATPFNDAVIYIALAVIFAGMFLVATRKTGSLIRMRWALVGALTYPLYLIHQQVGYMILNAAPDANKAVLLAVTVGVVLAIAYAVHRWVERPSFGPLRRWLLPAKVSAAPVSAMTAGQTQERGVA
jgi:peptidoglycan/LPS O-acetylase OafA/YrhL